MNNNDFGKVFEIALNKVLVKDDNAGSFILNKLKYFKFIFFNKYKTKTYSLHNKTITVSIPDFFNHNSLKIDKIKTEEFYYKKKLAASFALQSSYFNEKDFIIYRKQVGTDRGWTYTENFNFTVPLKYHHHLMVFINKKLISYYKTVIIIKLNDDFLVMTFFAPRKFFFDLNSFINNILSSIKIN